MEMYNPPHPGEIIREFCLDALELSVTDAAKALGVTRKRLSATCLAL
jgi:addiction module HigA family antidote